MTISPTPSTTRCQRSRRAAPLRRGVIAIAVAVAVMTGALAAHLLAPAATNPPRPGFFPGWAMAGAAATEVIGDDEHDVFIGSGSLLLPGGMGTPGRAAAADCPGCRWRATLACDLTSADACRGAARLCTGDDRWLRIWLARPGGAWEDLGSACFGPGGPATRVAAEALIRQQAIVAVPPLAPGHRPPAGILPHLPVHFSSGQISGPRTSAMTILGLRIDLTIVPRWDWAFGDGRTTEPGSGPHADVDHAYSRPGLHSVRVRTTWTGTYTADGLGPLVVAQPVTQEATVVVGVGEARAVLTR